MIIFSASLPGICLLPDRAVLCMRFSVRDAITRMRSTIPVHSAPAHICEMGGGLRGVVNDLL
jgi:hypothetical protein